MVPIEFGFPVLFACGVPENELLIRIVFHAHQNEVVNDMRTFKSSMLAGIGAVALAGAFVAPGIASAEAAGPLGSLGSLGSSNTEGPAAPAKTDTKSIQPDSRLKVTATAYDNCTVEFNMEATDSDNVNWVVDYRIDGEEATIDAEGKGEFFDVYYPVVTNQEDVAASLNAGYDGKYDVGVGEKTVDLSQLERIAPTADGSHTVEFKLYRGSPVGGWDADSARQTGEITVTGCPTESPLGSLGSLDVFGSIEGLFSTEQ